MNLYFDNGSTTYPKPREVAEAMANYTLNCGGSYGRGSHSLSVDTTQLVEECRDMIGELLGAESGDNIAWSKNATEAANMVIHSLPLKGKRVLVSPLEHNCTIRPLVAAGAELVVMPHFSDGMVNVTTLSQFMAVGDYFDIDFAVVNHQSNINGVIQPIKDIYSILRGAVEVMVDTAQSLGYTPFDVKYCDYAIFTGHKGLYGPTGVGGLYASDTSLLLPIIEGGTGSNSESFAMPTQFPEFLEVGTLNSVGIAGLKGALECDIPRNHTHDDFMDMLDEISAIKGVKVYRANKKEAQGELFSFNIEGVDGSLVTYRLEQDYGIATRFGLHCSALAHKTLNTTKEGLVRISTSHYHTKDDFKVLVDAIRELYG